MVITNCSTFAMAFGFAKLSVLSPPEDFGPSAGELSSQSRLIPEDGFLGDPTFSLSPALYHLHHSQLTPPHQHNGCRFAFRNCVSTFALDQRLLSCTICHI